MQDIFFKRRNVATRQNYVTKLLMENGVAHLSYLLFKGKDTLGRHYVRKHKTTLDYGLMETIPWNQTKGWRYAYFKKFRVSEGFRPADI